MRNYLLVLQDHLLLLMCILVGDVQDCTREWERTECVSQPHCDSHVLFSSDLTSFHSSHLLLVLLLLSVGMAGLDKYITGDLCCVPNKQDFPQIFPQLWTKLHQINEALKVTYAGRFRDRSFPSNYRRFKLKFLNREVVESQRAINVSPLIEI